MVNKIKSANVLLKEIVRGIENLKGEDIKKMDLRGIQNTPFEFFVICSGNSNIHIRSIVNSIQKNVSKVLYEKPLHVEGFEVAEWVLIDYVNVVVHVFQKRTRKFYNIEELWGDAVSTPVASNY